jgi:hypothetical protein
MHPNRKFHIFTQYFVKFVRFTNEISPCYRCFAIEPNPQLRLKLCLDRLRLQLRPALQRGVAWLTTLRPQDVADVADPAVLWRMELEMLQLAVVVGGLCGFLGKKWDNIETTVG